MAQAINLPDAPGVVIFKDAAITALIAAALLSPIVGLYTIQESSTLVVYSRFFDVGMAALIVFLGKLALSGQEQGYILPAFLAGLVLIIGGLFMPLQSDLLKAAGAGAGGVILFRIVWQYFRPQGSAETGAETGKALSRWMSQYGPWIISALIIFALAFPWLPFADRRLLDLATLVLTYVLLGWGLNIVVGLAGLLDLGYVAFYAVGAYSFALLAHNFEWSFWACLPIAAMLAALFGLVLGFPVLRLRGDYLAIVTLGFGEMIRIILLNWVPVTGGPDGISGIPKPTFFGLPFQRRAPEGVETFHQFFDLPYRSVDRIIFLFYIVLLLIILANWFIQRIRRLPIGRAWEALREDEIACRSLGLNPTNIKLSAFALGAMFGGVAGTVFAARQSFISPESFTFIESAIILSVVVLGGMGSQAGVALAAIVLIGLPEWFRELEQYRMLAFGALMVVIMTWRPRGLLSVREPTVRLSDSENRP